MPTSTVRLGIFYMPQIYDMGPTVLLASEGRRAEDFLPLKILTASARFEPANLGTERQHATIRLPKPLGWYLNILRLDLMARFHTTFHHCP
jgi:hypothetical protein